MSLFAAPGPRWFSIPAGRPFLEDLARGLTASLGGPDILASALVLTPTRRAGRDLAEAFLAISAGGAMLLPQVRALGDLDEGEPPFEPGDLNLDLAPAISPVRRRFELARLISDNQDQLRRKLDALSALELADALAAFLDSVQIEEVDLGGRLDALVEGELAEHWKISAEFLALALAQWPRRLAAMGLMDVAQRRVALLRALGQHWRDAPPAHPVIAAGSTGSAPATADLLRVIAELPQGCVVLPGLDANLADDAWEEVEDQHPQGGLKRLLRRAGIDRGGVRPWRAEADSPKSRWRRRLINEALRPPEATADWLVQIGKLRDEGAAAGVDPVAEGLEGLTVIAAHTEEEAATVVALLLREALETPGKTAALATPDAALARRVSARLTRWGVTADTSAGAPLAAYPVAALIALLAQAALDPFDPVMLLGVAKHRFARFGLAEGRLEAARRGLERFGLRGARKNGWEQIAARLTEAAERTDDEGQTSPGRVAAVEAAFDLLTPLRDVVERLTAPFADGRVALAEATLALTEALEIVAAGPAGGLGDLWNGLAGEAAASLLSSLLTESDGLPPLGPGGFVELIEQSLARETVRGGGASHPRLRILGAIEARLVTADRLILAGLEEGVWPRGAPVDPFLSRPMRATLKLPPPERRVGLSAHDFAQGASAPEVVLVHAERREGAPAVASRWLWRLETLVKGAEATLPSRPELRAMARDLDAPGKFKPASRPRPTPPIAARPRKLPVTSVERWIRDPYAIYARYSLGLRRLDLPDEPIEAMARGTAVHAAFERFAHEHPGELDGDAEAAFADILMTALRDSGIPEHRLARERALTLNVAPWVIAFERRRRGGARLIIEQTGEHVFDAPAGPFRVTARADRLELRGGSADVLDFKTGAAPTRKQIESGLAPQLTLTAAILREGGFDLAGRAEPGQLLYVRVSGGRIPGREELRAAPGESTDLAQRALAGLKQRVAAFDEVTTPYLAWAAPQFMGLYGGDYDHLARLWEWGVLGGDEEML